MQLELKEVVNKILDSASDKDSFREALGAISQYPAAQRLVVMLQVLSQDSGLPLVRLELAKLLWQLECQPFALEQLVFIKKNTRSASLDKLVSRLGGMPAEGAVSGDNPQSDSEAKTLASLDFDIEVLDPDK